MAFASGDWFEQHRFALGVELNHFRFGQANFRGNNFIVNTQEEALASGYARLNERNRWAFPGALNVKSIFAEDFIRVNDALEAFVAARWDSRALEAPGNGLTNFGLAWQVKQFDGLVAELQVKNLFGANNLYPATSVAGEGQGNQGVPALEARSAWLSLEYRF